MDYDKVNLLMEIFNVYDSEVLKNISPISLENWLYNFMDNDDFVDMVKSLYIAKGGEL